MTLAIRPPSNLPAWVRWVGPNANLGEVVYTTHFFGYEPLRRGRLPMGYTTKLDWRDVELMKTYVRQLPASTHADPRRPGGACGQCAAAGPPGRGRRARWRAPGAGRTSRSVDAGRARRLALHRRHHGDGVRRSHDAVRGGRQHRRVQQVMSRRTDRAREARDPGDRLASPLRSLVGPASGRRRGADGHLAARQRRDLQ